MKRDEQIELLVNANERKDARVQGWLKDSKVAAYIRFAHERTLALKKRG